MKRVNMLEIHSKQKGIEDFYEGTKESEEEEELEATNSHLELDDKSLPDVLEDEL